MAYLTFGFALKNQGRNGPDDILIMVWFKLAMDLSSDSGIKVGCDAIGPKRGVRLPGVAPGRRLYGRPGPASVQRAGH
jgi:hypothetical protein